MIGKTKSVVVDLGAPGGASSLEDALRSHRPLVLYCMGGDPPLPAHVVPALLRHPMPVAGVLAGRARGVLAAALLCCDVVYWLPRATLQLEPAGRGEATLLSLRVGSTSAGRVWFGGGTLNRQEALRSGWALPAKDHAAAVHEASARCEGLSASALDGLRSLLYRQHGLALGPAWALERAAFALAFAGGDPSEGVAAFLEKRKPRF